MIKSLLPINTIVYEESCKRNYALNGRGEQIELQIAGTHETEHELTFPIKYKYSIYINEIEKIINVYISF